MKHTYFLNVCLFVILSCMIAACSATIDGTSEESMTISVAQMKEGLDEGAKAAFEADLALIVVDAMDLKNAMKAAFKGEKVDSDAKMDSVRGALNGMTVEQVAKRAQEIREKQAAEEFQEAREKYLELMMKKEESERAQTELATFAVTDARLYKQKDGWLEEPVIEMTITNGTAHAVSRAYFRGRVVSPGRSIPWIEEDFNYSIAGGVEPGETQELHLSPNMFSPWGQVEVPADAVMTVTTTRLDGVDGTPVVNGMLFSDRDGEKLEELLSEYPELLGTEN